MNPHPPLSAFPVVLLVLVAIFEAASLLARQQPERRAEFLRINKTLLLLLALMAPLTYYSGYFGAELASQTFSVPDAAIGRHQLLAQCFLMSLVPLLGLAYVRRLDSAPALLVFWYLALLGALGLGLAVAHAGGELVFEHGAGVSANLLKAQE